MTPSVAMSTAGTPKATGRTFPGFRLSFGATSKKTLELAD